MSDFITTDLPDTPARTLDAHVATVACVFRDEQQVTAAVQALRQSASALGDVQVGASDAARAQALVAELGLTAPVDATDPLKGVAGLCSEEVTRASVDRGGVIGAATGALLGLLLSFTPAVSLLPVGHPMQLPALVLLMFVTGMIVGSVLGAAFAPQSSSHAGFRLIDGMHEGGIALITRSTAQDADALQKILQECGGTGITRL